MENLSGKRLLVLGGTSATFDLVKNAKEMGVYTIVTDNIPSGVAKEIADEQAMVSTTDYEGLKTLIDERNIDGVFCGPSEFNIRNLIRLCEKNGLRCYTTMDLWNQCANKDLFKKHCIQNGVDCPNEFDVSEDSTKDELENIDYPVIVKPVDSHSSNGITICFDPEKLRKACSYARSCSESKRIIVEKYIENGGELFGARYIIRNGEPYPYLLIDTYVTDSVNNKGPISHFTYAPSKYSKYYMENVDIHARNMIKSMGIKNGTAFFQALPYNGKIYFHEMGYRLSGGMLFKFTVPLMGINDMQMMIRYALGGEICTDEELSRIDVTCNGKHGAQINIPLSSGTIGSIEGLDEIRTIPCVKDFIQYYKEGDTIQETSIGTLGQHFGRFTLITDTASEIQEVLDIINKNLIIKDITGNTMNVIKFDIKRTLR